MQYKFIVYLLQPIDEKDGDKQKNIRNFLDISKKEQQNIIKQLYKEEFIQKVGNIMVLTNQKESRGEIESYLKNNKIDINPYVREFVYGSQ